jgi:hypothetical protein
MLGHWDVPWHERPVEEAALLNPAFGGELLARTVTEYGKLNPLGCPLPLLFLVLPLVLHPGTRTALPRRANTLLAPWVAEHESTLTSLSDRILSLRRASRESFILMLQKEVLIIGEDRVRCGKLKLKSSTGDRTDEVTDIVRSAGLVGRWFATQRSLIQTLQTLGLRP